MSAGYIINSACVFQAEGENVNKLEKADILELTVKHLHRITRPRDAAEDVHRFQVGRKETQK